MDSIIKHLDFFSVKNCYIAVFDDCIDIRKTYKNGTVGFTFTSSYLRVYADHGHDVKYSIPVQIETYQYISCIEAFLKWEELNNKMEELDSKEAID